MYAAYFGDEGVTRRRGVMQPTCAPGHVEIKPLARNNRKTGSETVRNIGNTELEATANDVRIAEHLSGDWKTKSTNWNGVRWDEMENMRLWVEMRWVEMRWYEID